MPTVSIIWAAFSVSNLACSISILDKAISCCIVPWEIKGFPKATLLLQRSKSKIPKWLSENLLDSFNHELEGSLGISNESHAVVYPTRTKSSLSYLKSSSFTQQNVGDWNFDINKVNLSMTTVDKLSLCFKSFLDEFAL